MAHDCLHVHFGEGLNFKGNKMNSARTENSTDLEDEMSRYESIDFKAQRPPLSNFDSGPTPEFYRWYDDNAKCRVEPLTFEQLTEYLMTRGYKAQRAATEAKEYAITADDWAWYKAKLAHRSSKAMELGTKYLAQAGYSCDIQSDGFQMVIVIQDPVFRCGLGADAGKLIPCGTQSVKLRTLSQVSWFLHERN